MAAALAELPINEPPTDPDAQATVTDFLDYTEYLPSDLIRSLTLIRGLDETFNTHSNAVHDLTRQYGQLPSLAGDARADPAVLRSQISTSLDRAVSARESSYAEARRLCDAVDRHYNRLNSIISKLHALPKPPSRDPTPEVIKSPDVKRSRSGRKLEAGPVQKITLLVNNRKNRIVVPGQPLYDHNSPLPSTEHSDDESEGVSPVRPGKKYGTDKGVKIPKVSRTPRDPTMTMKAPPMPPEDAVIGGPHLPWTWLNEYEMYKLRKKMKKNANWEPSPIMIARELAEKGRGWDNYYQAKNEAEKNGTPFVGLEKTDSKTSSTEDLAVKKDAASPTAIKLKVKEKGKKHSEAEGSGQKDRAKEAAAETELAAGKLRDLGSSLKNLFGLGNLQNAISSIGRSNSSPITTPALNRRASKPSRKRKHEESTPTASPSVEPDQVRKKPKLLPKRPSTFGKADTITSVVSLKPSVTADSSTLSSVATPVSSIRATQAQPVIAPKPEISPAPSTSRLPSRPASRHSARHSTAHSIEPAVSAEKRSLRRKSTPAPSTHGIPVPALEISPRTAATAASRRPKRGAPGKIITEQTEDGGVAVSVSTRKNKPGPKKGWKAATIVEGKENKDSKAELEIRTDVDGKQEVIDPDEPRYCICNEVSYGDMILCEMDEDKVRLSHFSIVWFRTDIFVVRRRLMVSHGLRGADRAPSKDAQVVLPCM